MIFLKYVKLFWFNEAFQDVAHAALLQYRLHEQYWSHSKA